MSIPDSSVWDRILLGRSMIRANTGKDGWNLSHSSILRTILENDSAVRHWNQPIAVMARDCGMSRKQTHKSIDDLVQWGLIERTKTGYAVLESAIPADTKGEPSTHFEGRTKGGTREPSTHLVGSGEGCPGYSVPSTRVLSTLLKDSESYTNGAAPYGGPPVRTAEEEAAARLAYEERMAAHHIRTEPMRLAKIAKEKEADELRRSLILVRDGDRPLAKSHPPANPTPDTQSWFNEPDISAFEQADDSPRYRDGD